jgi:hypothetical protein
VRVCDFWGCASNDKAALHWAKMGKSLVLILCVCVCVISGALLLMPKQLCIGQTWVATEECMYVSDFVHACVCVCEDKLGETRRAHTHTHTYTHTFTHMFALLHTYTYLHAYTHSLRDEPGRSEYNYKVAQLVVH